MADLRSTDHEHTTAAYAAHHWYAARMSAEIVLLTPPPHSHAHIDRIAAVAIDVASTAEHYEMPPEERWDSRSIGDGMRNV
ncbi:hypothetical protein CO656_18055 [Sinorhizobium sp. FG01]|uniref:Uncharacterized protein n=1 Tax=Sinorhizobium americanum TaxID=194963 RepID=A0A2S3YG03_9HYPH|nr:hypothetical protein CO656_18055 [Sinorhizobium sp. FG01]POH25168.1 hypothetical protein ATY31_27700 [Sinorhizobium americanum]